MAGLIAYDLARIVNNPDYFSYELRHGMEAAPVYERFADAGRHVIRSIHSIPTLFDPAVAPLGEVEVYVGRAGATPRHVQSRWRHHLTEKKHDHGAVVLRCSTDVVDIWETAAVRAIKGLDARGRLCVRNASASGQGSLPSTKTSVIYITWQTKQRRADITLADKRMIDDVAREVAEHTRDLGVQVESLKRALDPITRPARDRAEIAWHPMHDGEDDDPDEELG